MKKFKKFDDFYAWAKSLKSTPFGKIVDYPSASSDGDTMTATFIIEDKKKVYYHSDSGWETEIDFKKRNWSANWEKLKDTEREFILLMFPDVHQWEWSKQDLKSPDRLVIVCLNKAIKEKLVEKRVCSRCGGTGYYSYNYIDGTMCYGCRGTKWQYPRITKKLIKEIKRRKQ